MVIPSSPQSSEDELKKVPIVLSPHPPREPAWGVADVLLLGTGTFLVIFVLINIFLLPAVLRLQPGQSAPLTVVAKAAIPAELIAYLLLIICVKQILARRGHPRLMNAIGWNWPAKPAVIGLAILGALAAVVANTISRHVDIPPDAPILEMMKDRVVVELFLAFGILVAPFAEEFYFRGLLYPALQRNIGTVSSVLITSILFALMHASQLANSLGAVVVLLVVGLLLTTIRARTGSLAAPFIVHFAYNSTLFLGSILAR